MKPIKILFLLPYPLHKAPSQRFRMEAFFPLIESHAMEVHTACFLNETDWFLLYKKGSLLQKAGAVVRGFANRWRTALSGLKKFDYVVVHREAAPLGPPVFEWLVAKVWKKKLIFDFDDAIWIPAISEQNKLARYIKCFWKTKWICKWAYKVAAGNEYLANFARQYNERVSVVPTSVDTGCRYKPLVDQAVDSPSIGWTGSHSTIKYLDAILPVLQELQKEHHFNLYIICNRRPDFTFPSLKYIEWKESSEIEDLRKIHIGLMPLEADAWSEGKCGFKIIQYLALGIPAVASPVGVNTQIIDKNNGFLCREHDEWYQALSELLENASLRQEMGRNGRIKIVDQYSLQANEALFLDLFK
ncbi:MAG: glycosyltransferase [Flavisolibacter sp.]